MNSRTAFIAALLLMSQSCMALAQEVWPGRVLIKFSEEISLAALRVVDGIVKVDLADFDQAAMTYGIYEADKIFKGAQKPEESYYTDLSRWYRLEFSADIDPAVVVSALEKLACTEEVEVDRKCYQTYRPNDIFYDNCWFLTQIHADEAWYITKGSAEVVIAIVDSGIDSGHVDLKSEMWVNPGEDLNGNGIVDLEDWNGADDDQNGYVDDFWGWDFASMDNIPHPDNPSENHGTLCASSAAAATDNIEGVASPGFNTRLMALRSNMYVNNLSSCITYAADNGADILSNSWGSNTFSPVIRDAVAHCHDVGAMFVTSAGNNDYWTPPWPAYPSLYPDVLSVGATTESDQMATFSNYCTTPFDGVIDVMAPGQNILSASTLGTYETWQGTSSSSPITAGVCALVLSIDPTLTPAEVETLLVHGCDDIYPQNPSFAYGILGHGRINALKTILQISHYLSFYSLTLTDIGNGDGRADPGETVELSIVVQNHPEAQIAEGITGMLVCDDEAVTVTSGSVSYGSVMPGEIGFNSTPYTFTVAATDPHWTEFSVILTDTYGSEQEVSFELELGRPEILVVDDDGGENYQ
ncbi:S8 family serine peptidase, partial [bacterium]|nr:S8 family serine peptidase [bacterium]